MTKILHTFESLNKILKEEKPSTVCIITSDILAKKLRWAIKEIKAPHIEIVLLPDGEKAKDWNEVEKLLKKFIELNLDRDSILIALGGGTIGDVVGFAASIYLRGIRYIQMPTTLLAQVDSAHGGKTGINFSGYKNQIGTFYLPIAVVLEKEFLKSISEELIVDGLGEIIKAGFIKDPSILSLLKKETVRTLIQSKNLSKIIDKSIKVKHYHINKDFDDKNIRQLLNVGHTIGHAIELKYKMSHGRAVIIGMFQEFSITETLGFTSPSVRKNLIELLSHLGIEIDRNLKADWKTILHDKKIIGNKITFPTVLREGKLKVIILDLKVLKRGILYYYDIIAL